MNSADSHSLVDKCLPLIENERPCKSTIGKKSNLLDII